MLEDPADRGVGGAADPGHQLPGPTEVEIPEFGEGGRERGEIVGDVGPEHRTAERPVVVLERQDQVAGTGEALHHPGAGALEGLALHPVNGGGAATRALRVGEDVAAEVAGADLDVDQLVAPGVEDLEADLVELDEGTADLAEGAEIEQLAQRELGLEDGVAHGAPIPPAPAIPFRRSRCLKSCPRNSSSESPNLFFRSYCRSRWR